MLKVVVSPDPRLAEVCEPCDVNDASLKRLSKQMAALMYKNAGCGIAAPQVGVNKRIIVIDVDWDGDKGERNPIVLVNPEVVELQGEPEPGGEGCLSCPGVLLPVTRQPWARVRYFDLDGDEWEIEGDGLLGRCLQHEIDHLNGKTLFETCDADVRIDALRAYEQARREGAKPGDTHIEVGMERVYALQDAKEAAEAAEAAGAEE